MVMATTLQNRRAGFTISELALVIIVIAILVRIAIGAYAGVQAKSRDTIRRNDLATLSKSIQVFATREQSWTPTNCGDTTNTLSGYTEQVYGTNTTLVDCLKNYDGSFRAVHDPSGCINLTDTGSSCRQNIRGAYAAYSCIPTDGTYWLVAKLETISDQSMLNTMCATAKTAAQGAGFNYALKVR